MAGVKALRKIQVGAESTSAQGTAVAATTYLRLNGTLEDNREVVFPKEDVGLLSGTDRQYIPKLMANVTLEGEGTFEQIPYVYEAGIEHVTPTTDTGSGYIYTYTFATTAQKSPRTYTIEGGDDQSAEEIEYAFVKDFTLSGNAGEAWMLSSNWSGRQVSTSTYTGALSIPTVEDMLFSKSTLYIDPTSDTVGTTAKSNTLLSAEFKGVSGFQEVFDAQGNLYFGFVKQVEPEVTLAITFEHDSTAQTEKDAWRAGTARQISLKTIGTALSSSGAHATKKHTINMAGKWEKFEKIDEQNGNDIIKGLFRARYNATAALFCNVVVVNELSALP